MKAKQITSLSYNAYISPANKQDIPTNDIITIKTKLLANFLYFDFIDHISKQEFFKCFLNLSVLGKIFLRSLP